ncbi:MAG TPA: serine hydrolase domain-containing protein [Holophaga sp.]|nr:serine hydrolase domain-containing protein [Holophaga sp.]HPS67382.1 serine hydrolase domain-containing protein [Holophaga sp.]
MQGLLSRTCLRAATLLLLPVLAGSGLSSQPVQDYGKAIQAVQSLVAGKQSAYGSPGLAVALVEGDRTVWSGAFGLADRDKQAPVTGETIFELGSISKLFTCVAVMQLREQGKVDLDKPLAAYIPEFAVRSRFPAGKEAITLRMLMTHHSGIMTDDDPWETTHPERYFYRALLEHVKGTDLLFPPGQRWHYSSFGVNLLGLLVERVSGMDFSAYMKKHVLDPLEMPNASFDIKDLPEARIAAAYNYNPGWDLIPTDEIRPAGSLRAPLPEVAHFISMVFGRGAFKGRRLLSPESVAEMLRIQGPDNPLDQGNSMGLGFRASFEELKGGALLGMFGHGGMARHRSTLELIPAWNVGFVAAVNDYNARNAFLWGTGEALFKEVFAARGQAYGYAGPLAKAPGAAQDLQKITGEYASIYGHRLLKLSPDGALTLEAPGAKQPPAHPELIPLANGDYAMDMEKDPALVYHFGKDADGTVTWAVLREKGVVVNQMVKLPPAALPVPWAARAGTYEPAGAEDKARTGIPEITLQRRGERLLVKAALTPSNREDLGQFYANAPFPLRFLDDAKAEVVNGALSGFDGYLFSFQETGDGTQLKLQDASGAAAYRLKK